MTSERKQASTAAAVTLVNIAVAISVNLLTSSWSWLLFAVLAVLSAAWVGLEVTRALPRRTSGESLGAPTPPGVSGGFVPRPELTGRIERSLLANKTRNIGITTGLAGAGGFGKTTLAAEVCARPEIKAAFALIEWVTVGQEVRGAALADVINDIAERVDGRRPGLTSPEQAGIRLGELLKLKGRSLLVVDDVWTAEQLRPFLNAGRGCTLLVTTRIPDLLPADAETVEVDQMSRSQARELVTGGITDLPESIGERLLDITGRWPLALSLANATLRRAARDRADVAETAKVLLRRLQDLGPTALDVSNAARRDRAVAATLESSLGVLDDRRDRVLELAIFPEDTGIPLDLVLLLWRKTANLSPREGEQLCHELAELSLVTLRGDLAELRLHDVIRTYLRHECGPTRLGQLHNELLDAVASTLAEPARRPVPWWTLPTSAEYLWRTLAYHLAGAERTVELEVLATTPPWVTAKLRRFGPVALAEDLALVSSDKSRELTRFLDQLGHLLIPSTPEHAVVNALAQRLPQSPALDELRESALSEVEAVPRLVPRADMPDLPDPALNRVLAGHDGWVGGCAFAPDGSWLVSTAVDGIRIWHPESGQLLRLLEGTSDHVAVSPDGRFLAHDDGYAIRLLDTRTWQVHASLGGHQGWVSDYCFSSDGHTLISAGNDKTLRVWDTRTGSQLRSFKTPQRLDTCISKDDGSLVSADTDNLKIWDLSSGIHIALPMNKFEFPRDVTISPDQRWAVAPSSECLFVYDLTRLNEPPRELHHHTDLATVAFAPDSRKFATGGRDGLVVFWSVTGWRPSSQISAHGAEVKQLAFSPDGSVLASAGDDGTVRLWNPARARTETSTAGLAGSAAQQCIAAADGSWLAVAKSDSISIYDPLSGYISEEFKYPGGAYSLSRLDNEALMVEMIDCVLVCEATNWKTSRALRLPNGSYVSEMSTGGSLVCVTDRDDRLLLWDIKTWKPPMLLEIGDSGLRFREEPLNVSNTVIDRLNQRLPRRRKSRPTAEAAIGPKGEWIAVSIENAVHIAAPKTEKTLTTLSFDSMVESIMAVPNGRWLVVVVDDTVQYWNTESWTLEKKFSDTHELAAATASDWSPDCSLLATVSDDRILRIHDSATWECLTELRLDGELTGCSWLSNDRLVAVGHHGVYWFTYSAGT